jgi:hypothetical protein
MLTTTTMRLAPVALACLFLAGSVSAEGFWNGSGNLECIASCHAGSKECYAGARDGFQTCSLGFGCEEIRDALRATCYGPDRDHEACKEAWGGLRTCLEPCVSGLYEDATMCRQEVDSCITDQCGTENPLTQLLERLRQYKR